MTNKDPESTISPDEISSAFAQSFAHSIGHLTFEKLRLEKIIQTLQTNISRRETDNARLKAENSNLIKAHISLETQLNNLQKELDERPSLEEISTYETTVIALEAKIKQLIEAGPTLAQSAALGMAKTEGRKEKAAPEDGLIHS